jgi:hypothetical protein
MDPGDWDSPPVINRRLICISGYKQSKAQPTGLEKLWLKLRVHEDPQCRTSYMTWDADWPAFAEHMMRTGPTDPNQMTICVFAYSWGCGHGALDLFSECRHRGLTIESAVLADPVYHKWWAPWRALVSPIVTPTIVIPDNVTNLWYTLQRENKPAGHECVLAKGNKVTTINEPVMSHRTHTYMDEDPLFQDKCLEIADGAVTA